jgi:hypothetical protein
LNVLKIDKTSNFFFKKYTQVFLLRSFIKAMKYLDPKNDGVKTNHRGIYELILAIF